MKKPVKPNKRAAHSVYHLVPPEEANAGKLFRVRDKDWDNLWGENLTYAEANALKEKVCGSGKSRTARVEDQSVQPPDWYATQLAASGQPAVATGNADPQLERLRAKAIATSRATAATAQQRHAQAAARDRSSSSAAKRVAVPPSPVPVISTELPEVGELEDGAIGDSDLSDLMADAGSDMPSAADLSRAKEEGAKVKAEITAKAKAMYEANMKPGHVSWDQLSKEAKAGWEFDAANAPPEEPADQEEPTAPDVVDVPDPVADAGGLPAS